MTGLEVAEVIDRLDGVGAGAALAAEKLAADQLDATPAHTGHALAVAADARDRARNMGAVVIRRASGIDVVAVAREVPAADIVDITVAVIVHAVGGVVRIDPDVGGQILVVEVDALVDHADNDVAATGVPGRPRFAGLRTELVGRAGRVAMHAVQRAVGVVRVVRNGRVGVGPVRLGVFHRRVVHQGLHRDRDADAGRQLQQRRFTTPGGAAADRIDLARAKSLAHCDLLRGAGAIAEFDDQFICLVRSAGLQTLQHEFRTATRARGGDAEDGKDGAGQRGVAEAIRHV